jgi:Protein of unknown function (DUF1822)
MLSTIETLIEIYPDDTWIDLSAISQLDSKLSARDLADRDYHLSRVDLNYICMVAVKKWLSEIFDLELKSVFPCTFGGKENLEFISGLVNGFALQVGKTRLVFIPSQSIDLTEIEIPQEWVDLPNWAADYYIPIQVDVEGKYLHLWTFISHYNLKNSGEFDRVFRNYEISDGVGTKNLDVLFTACELHALGKLTPKRAVIDPLPALASADVNELIEQLQQHRSVFSPRLNLPFVQWGAILNYFEYLKKYLTPFAILVSAASNKAATLLVLSHWLDEQLETIHQEWKSIGEFFQQPQWQTGLRGDLDRDNDLTNQSTEIMDRVKELTICPQRSLMYRDIGKDIENLVNTIQNTASQQERWEAIEYLWALDPEHPALPIYKLMDLGLFFQGEQLSLLVSIVRTKKGKLGILIRLSPNRDMTTLPSGIKLSRLDEQGNVSREEIAQDNKRQCLQLIFDADFGDLFSICVTLNDNHLTQKFQV